MRRIFWAVEVGAMGKRRPDAYFLHGKAFGHNERMV